KLRVQHVWRRDSVLEVVQAARGRYRNWHALTENDPCRVDQMDTPVDKMPVACGLFQAPIHMSHLRAIRDERGRATPQVPIKRCRRLLRCWVFRSGSVVNV